MYTVLFLLLITSAFMTTPVMSDPDEKFPFHEVVQAVANGYFNVKSAKEKIEELFLQHKDPNQQNNYRTAAQLSVYYCVNFAGSSEDQFCILESLLDHDSPRNVECNKKKILEDLDEAVKRLTLSQRGLKGAPFQVTMVSGGGSFINNEDGDEEQVKSKENRIKRVRELLEELKN